jgi:hypothetical protein
MEFVAITQGLPGYQTNFIIHYWAFIIRHSLEHDCLSQAMADIEQGMSSDKVGSCVLPHPYFIKAISLD